MKPEPWDEVRERFHEALDLPKEERATFLAELHRAQPGVASRVERLLEEDSKVFPLVDRVTEVSVDAGDERLEPEPLLGRRIGEYRVAALLGVGGTAQVVRGVPDGEGSTALSPGGSEGGADVAIKVLHARLASGETLRRFHLEARTLASLEHPNIVAPLGTELLEDGRPCLLMELIDGRPIDGFVREERLTVESLLELFGRVCDAVTHAHRSLVVHRDLKPANILVQTDGTPKVLDFGVAKLLAPEMEDRTTHLGGIAPLTLRYASPEQTQGGRITTATDVFALGRVLQELLELTSKAPGRRVGRGRDLALILETATSEEPDRRYSSVERLAEDLRRYRGGLPILARQASKTYRVGRFIARNRISCSISGVLFIGFLLAMVGMFRQMVRAESAERLGWDAHRQALYVASFFHTLVAASDTERLRADPGFMEALEEAAGAVGIRYVDDPEAEGRVRLSISVLFYYLGRHESAIEHLDRALEIAAVDEGFDENDRLSMRRLQGRIEEALANP